MSKPFVPHLVVTVTIPKSKEFVLDVPVGAKIVGVVMLQVQSRVQLASVPPGKPEIEFALTIVVRGASTIDESSALPKTTRQFAFTKGSDPVLLGPNRYVGSYRLPGQDFHLFERL